MAMNRYDTAKFVTSLTERIQNENPKSSQQELYTKVFGAVTPLIVNGDIDSQMWVDIAEYLFPGLKTKESKSQVAALNKKIEDLERELATVKSKNQTLVTENRKLKDEKEKTKRVTPVMKPPVSPYSPSYSSDPCARTSSRSGGC